MTLLFILLFSIFAVTLITFHDSRMYCYIYDHSDWRQDIFAIVDAAFEVNCNYHFIDSSRTFTAVVWKGKLASVHLESNSNCILSTFHKYYSKKLAKLLMAKI